MTSDEKMLLKTARIRPKKVTTIHDSLIFAIINIKTEDVIVCQQSADNFFAVKS